MTKDENQTLSLIVVYIAYFLLVSLIVFFLDTYPSITLSEIVLFILIPIISLIYSFLNCKYLKRIWINPFIVHFTVLLVFIIIKNSHMNRDPFLFSLATYSISLCFPSVLSSLFWISVHKITSNKSIKLNIFLMMLYTLIYILLYWIWHYVLNS